MPDTSLLRDCHRHGAQSELFVVEGRSAADALDAARRRQHQAICVLQGKLPALTPRNSRKVLQNVHVDNLLSAINRRLPDSDRPAYGRIFLVAEADADGIHNSVLALRLLQQFATSRITAGECELIRVPAFRVSPGEALANPAAADTGNGNDVRLAQFVWDPAARRHWSPPAADAEATLQQIKGVGSLDTADIWRLILDPATRRSAPVSASVVAAVSVDVSGQVSGAESAC